MHALTGQQLYLRHSRGSLLLALKKLSRPTNQLHTQVLTFGNGSQGAVGLGTEDNEYEPEMAMEGALAAVGVGHYHSFCVDTEGQLWSWG